VSRTWRWVSSVLLKRGHRALQGLFVLPGVET